MHNHFGHIIEGKLAPQNGRTFEGANQSGLIPMKNLPRLAGHAPTCCCTDAKMNWHEQQHYQRMKTETKTKTGSKAQVALAQINSQIEELKRQRITLAEPLKVRFAEMRTELLDMETEIRELDPTWKPTSLRPKAEDKITEILTTKGQPMTPDEIIQAVGDLFTPWKIKNTLKKKSTGAKAVFAVNDGKYSVKASV